MRWIKGILFFIIAVITVSSSLEAAHDTFSKMAVLHSSVPSRTIKFGKLLIGNGAEGTISDHPVERPRQQSAQFPLAEAKLKRLGPSVHCGNDAMTLRVPGPRMPHLLVDRGEGSLVPVSEIPANCGFSVKRVRRDSALVAPYRGCHVRQQGGSYILPLIIMGAPVQVSCPVSSPIPTVSCSPSGMVFSLEVRADTVKLKVDGSWEPLLLAYSKCAFTLEIIDGVPVVTAPFTGSCWEVTDTERHLPLLYGERKVTLSCPLTPTTAPTTIPAAPPTVPAAAPTTHVDGPPAPQMYFPFPYGHPWYFPYSNSHMTGLGPVPATQAPPTTQPTTTTTLAPHEPMPLNPMYPLQAFNPYFYHHHEGASAVSSAPPYQPGWYKPLPFHHYPYGRPRYHHYPGYPVASVPTLPPPTTVPTTPAQPADVPQVMQYPMYPRFPPHFPYLYGFQSQATAAPTTVPTTTTTTPAQPADVPQVMQYPMYPRFPPHFPYLYGFQSQATAAPTPSPTTTTVAAKPAQYPGSLQVYPPFYGPQPVKYPFMPQFVQNPVFAPRSSKSASGPAQSSFAFRPHRHSSVQ